MLHPEINSAVIIPFTAFALGMIAIVCTYGRQMYQERWLEVGYPAGTIISRDVYHYFEKQGYKVFHISPVLLIGVFSNKRWRSVYWGCIY